MTSVSSALSISTAPSSSSSDHLFDSDSGSGSVIGAGGGASGGKHAPLKESKSVSCSYFRQGLLINLPQSLYYTRSPKTESRKLGGDRGYHSLEKDKTHKNHTGGQLPLRKTNSWAFTGSTGKGLEIVSSVYQSRSRRNGFPIFALLTIRQLRPSVRSEERSEQIGHQGWGTLGARCRNTLHSCKRKTCT